MQFLPFYKPTEHGNIFLALASLDTKLGNTNEQCGKFRPNGFSLIWIISIWLQPNR